MSKFLGPIHFWLYNKIQLQEELICDIAQTAVAQNWIQDQDAKALCRRDSRLLDEIIDEGNIHGWLQQHILDAEGRYAKLLTMLLAADESRMDILKQTAYRFGSKHGVKEDATAFDAYHALDSSLLNGMPCDRVNVVTIQENDHFAWKMTQDIHAASYEAVNGNVDHYYILRNEITRGIIANAGFALTSNDHAHYEIKKAV